MKLSVVVPIYKVEPYLRKCVDSLLNQDLPKEDYEIILVDDGSPDGCGEICDEYAAKFHNIKVVHRENGGLSAARNSGIEVAQGKYIQFVDSDDYLEPNVLKALVEKMEKDNLDILRFNYQNVNEKYEVFEPNKAAKRFVKYSEEVCDGVTFLNERFGYACYAVQFLIKTDILKNNNIFFKEGIVYEDVEWTPRTLLQANRIASTSMFVYYYLIRSGSITKTNDIEKIQKKIEDQFFIIGQCIDRYKEKKGVIWYKRMTDRMAYGVLNSICDSRFDDTIQYVQRLKNMGVFPLSFGQEKKRDMMKFVIINLSPNLYIYLRKRFVL